jgi:acyl-CoA synthetase (AMP-forming)/AMP-acid ligase II
VFAASLSGAGGGRYLRTGDLGFTLNGEVFITGRIKDLIIIRGQNYYPQDIELTAERAHPGLATHANAAFTLEEQQQAYLVIVQELARGAVTRWQLVEIAADICEAVANEHSLQAHCIVFIEPGSISKTTSGKIQRRACRQRYLDGTLPVIGQFRSGATAIRAAVATHQAEFVAVTDVGAGTRLRRRPAGEGPESQ